jgi:hypothetical protein
MFALLKKPIERKQRNTARFMGDKNYASFVHEPLSHRPSTYRILKIFGRKDIFMLLKLRDSQCSCHPELIFSSCDPIAWVSRLLLAALMYYFPERRDLFQGLRINANTIPDWAVYPVLHFSFRAELPRYGFGRVAQSGQ